MMRKVSTSLVLPVLWIIDRKILYFEACEYSWLNKIRFIAYNFDIKKKIIHSEGKAYSLVYILFVLNKLI